MKETGLMFKAPLVRGILEDLKTQTRRIAKLPHMNPLGEWEPTTVGGPGGGRTRDGKEVPLQVALGHTRTGDVICAPIQPGDRIYVRETFANHPKFPQIAFRADGEEFEDADGWLWEPKWTPCLLMPKTAARIWLEVTGVRVERLQSISAADAVRDGGLLRLPATGRYVINQGDQYFGGATHDPRELFQEIWDSTTGRPALPANTNSKRYTRVKHWLDTHPDTTSWAANPWVWVIDFKRIDKPQRAAA